VRFTVRRMMLAMAVVAIGLWVGTTLWPTSRILAAARRSVPGIIVQSVRAENFSGTPAWEVRGTDSDGTEWLLDITAKGEVLLKEAVAYGRPRPVVLPDGQ
jgi:hypothetical protein